MLGDREQIKENGIFLLFLFSFVLSACVGNKRHQIPSAEVPGVWEPPEVDAENWTPVKIRKCSYPWSISPWDNGIFTTNCPQYHSGQSANWRRSRSSGENSLPQSVTEALRRSLMKQLLFLMDRGLFWDGLGSKRRCLLWEVRDASSACGGKAFGCYVCDWLTQSSPWGVSWSSIPGWG